MTPPYHPCSNDEAEHLVQSFKLGMNKGNPKSAAELDNAVIDFLATYRTPPHTLTNVSPSEMLNGRHLRTILDLLHLCQTEIAKTRA